MPTKLTCPITELRLKLGLSITEFAKRFEVNRTFVSKVEHGHRDSLGKKANRRIARRIGDPGLEEKLNSFQWPSGAPELLRAQAAFEVLQNTPRELAERVAVKRRSESAEGRR